MEKESHVIALNFDLEQNTDNATLIDKRHKEHKNAFEQTSWIGKYDEIQYFLSKIKARVDDLLNIHGLSVRLVLSDSPRNDVKINDARPVPPFRCEEIERNQLAREWKSWKSSLEFYFEAYGVSDQKVMRAKLLHFGGNQLQRVCENLPDANKIPVVSTKENWFDAAIA
ncbi:uncharacterized protein LOC129718726 [Wyeomyia smithii]|uniref:uncharacterized protein LOC129718726 n=1 Tax=Wyeomyia smithii TaxID=174621 RepID=UPI00246821B6|nr:uncharacterized protein LOC129718726 [Wyeomyia smithii]